MTDYANTIAIVTGAASGIGLALSEALNRRGAVVVMADLNAAGLEAAAARLAGAGARLHLAPGDVAAPGAAERLITDTLARAGRLDWLFNNAGLGPSGDLRAFTMTDWRALAAVNLDAVVAACLAAYPHLVRQGAGHIINTASLSGLIPTPGMALYTATKHAVVGFSLALRAEARAYGVRVSAACPAFVRTNLRATTRARLGPLAVHPHPDDAHIHRLAPEACARAILRGVARNQALILTPWPAAVGWRLYQLWPGLFERLIFPRLLPEPKQGPP